MSSTADRLAAGHRIHVAINVPRAQIIFDAAALVATSVWIGKSFSRTPGRTMTRDQIILDAAALVATSVWIGKSFPHSVTLVAIVFEPDDATTEEIQLAAILARMWLLNSISFDGGQANA